MGETTGIAGWAKRVRTWFKDRGVYALGVFTAMVAALLFDVAGSAVRQAVSGLRMAVNDLPYMLVIAFAVVLGGLAWVLACLLRRIDLVVGREAPDVPYWGRKGVYLLAVAALLISGALYKVASAIAQTLAGTAGLAQLPETLPLPVWIVMLLVAAAILFALLMMLVEVIAVTVRRYERVVVREQDRWPPRRKG